MHYCLEVIIPPMRKKIIPDAIEEILMPFSENCEEENSHAFWDWYVLGGRWNGHKAQQFLNEEKVALFFEKLKEMEVKVSAVQAGKQKLADEFVEPVNELWKKHFSDTPFKDCPYFENFEDRYKDELDYPGNVIKLSELHPDTTCAHIILAGPATRYDRETNKSVFIDKFKINEMLVTSIWNGVSWQDTAWDGKVVSAIEIFKEKLSYATDEWKEKCLPTDDWLVVTVDYHS